MTKRIITNLCYMCNKQYETKSKKTRYCSKSCGAKSRFHPQVIIKNVNKQMDLIIARRIIEQTYLQIKHNYEIYLLDMEYAKNNTTNSKV